MPEPVNNPHHKPTKEELEEANKRLLEDLENNPEEEDKDEEEEDKEEDKRPDQEQEDQEEEQEEEENQDEEEKEEDQEEDKKPTEDQDQDKDKEEKDKKSQPDLKERYDNSTKEAQNLYKDNATMNKAIAEANSLPEPTEEELKAHYKDWDNMDDLSRELSKEAFINRRFREHINAASKEIRDLQDWTDRVNKFSEDPQTLIDYPELEGKINRFIAFAGDKSLLGTQFPVLVSSFLYNESKNAKPKNKGKMFENGKGGPNDKGKQKSDKLSIEEGAQLKKNNYRLYIEYLRAGKISNEVD